MLLSFETARGWEVMLTVTVAGSVLPHTFALLV
jgi:hypothetical protein